MPFWKNKGQPKENVPRLIATALLGTLLPFLDPVRSFPDQRFGEHHPAVFVNAEIKTLFTDDYLPATLYDVFEADKRLRNQFNGLRHAIFRLAQTGAVDRKSLRIGEQILPQLISYLRDREELQKSAIRPDVAEAAADIERNLPELLRRALSRTAISEHLTDNDDVMASAATPNEIDAQQIEALKHYQWNRLARLALETIAVAVHQINTELGKQPPGPNK